MSGTRITAPAKVTEPMDLSFVVVQALNGLASASSLFITACGLTLVFGVTRIVNFAHGSLYMIGAYTGATLVPRLLESVIGPLSFWAGILRLGAHRRADRRASIEVLLLRRIYGAPELFQLLATFGRRAGRCRTWSCRSSDRRTSSGRARRACAAPSRSSAGASRPTSSR